MSSTSSTVTSGKQASKQAFGERKTSKVVSSFADPISCFLFLFFLGELAL
jgi:hypothetical protein